MEKKNDYYFTNNYLFYGSTLKRTKNDFLVIKGQRKRNSLKIIKFNLNVRSKKIILISRGSIYNDNKRKRGPER